MSQISLPFEGHEGRGEGDFFFSDPNRVAVAYLERWRDWPLSIAVLTGPPRSGRSTLARQFARMSGGDVIDDAHEGDRPLDDHRLFHAWNAAQTEHRPLLLVGQAPPATWPVTLPDLRSRLAAVPHVGIDAPDDMRVVRAELLDEEMEIESKPVVKSLGKHQDSDGLSETNTLGTLSVVEAARLVC